jgi:hypothetical protein
MLAHSFVAATVEGRGPDGVGRPAIVRLRRPVGPRRYRQTRRSWLIRILRNAAKAATVVLIIWAIFHPQSPIGPHTPLDWIPLGLLNASTGLWLLAVIRHRAR